MPPRTLRRPPRFPRRRIRWPSDAIRAESRRRTGTSGRKRRFSTEVSSGVRVTGRDGDQEQQEVDAESAEESRHLGALLTLKIDDLVTPTADAVAAVIAVHALPPDQTCFDSGFRVPFGTFEVGKASNNSGDFSIFSGDQSGIDQVVLVTIPTMPFTADLTCLAHTRS